MSDNPQTAAAETGESTETNETAFASLDDIGKRYFGPDEVAGEGGQYFLAAQEAAKKAGEGTFLANFDFNADMGSEEGFPEGYGLAVVPVSQRVDGKTVTVAIVASAIPTVDMILSAENGREFVDDLVISALMTKVGNAGRPREGQTGVPILPKSLADFMEGGRKESTKGFMDVAPNFVKLLKANGMKNITTPMLRECIQSTIIAEQYYPDVSQERWVKLGNGIVAMGKAKKLDMSVVEHWIETRDEAPGRHVDDSVLDSVLAGLEV